MSLCKYEQNLRRYLDVYRLNILSCIFCDRFQNFTLKKSIFDSTEFKVGRSKPGAVLTGYNRPGQFSQSGQYWSIELLSVRLNIFSGYLEIMVVSWLIDYGYGLLVDNLVEFINITVDLSAKTDLKSDTI